MDAELMTVHEVAERLRVHDDTVRRLIRDGGLEHFRVRGTIRIPSSTLSVDERRGKRSCQPHEQANEDEEEVMASKSGYGTAGVAADVGAASSDANANRQRVVNRGKAPNTGPHDPRIINGRGPGMADPLPAGLMSAPNRAPQDEEAAWPANEGPQPSQSSTGSPPAAKRSKGAA